MPRTFWKNILRLIRTTKSRFFSLTAIVAIGVAFFVGVYSSSTIMSVSVDAYDDEYHLKDIQIYSNYGFTEDDIKAVSELPGVSLAEGAKFADVIASSGSDTYVTRVHSWNPDDTINQFRLVEGRLPENEHEALAERGTAITSIFPIGAEVTLSRPDDDLEDYLNVDSVTIVGLIDTPLYLNYSKENSTLSNQAIRTYLYVPESAFSISEDLEINVLTEKGASYNTFSSAYEDYIAPIREEVEQLAESRQDMRYESLKQEAEEKYNDGLREYREGEQTLKQETADAEAQLKDSEQKTADGWIQLESGIRELQDSEAQLITGEAENRKKLNDAVSQINAALPQIESGISDLSALSSGSADIYGGKKKLLETSSQLNDLKETLSLLPRSALFSSVMQQAGMTEEDAEELAAIDPDWQEKTCGELLESTEKLVAEAESGKEQLSASEKEMNAGLAEIIGDQQQSLSDLQNRLASDEENILQLQQEIRTLTPLVSSVSAARDGVLLAQVKGEYSQLLSVIDGYQTDTDLSYETVGEFFEAADADLDSRIAAAAESGEDTRQLIQTKMTLQYAAQALDDEAKTASVEMIRFLEEKITEQAGQFEMDENTVLFNDFRAAVLKEKADLDQSLADAWNSYEEDSSAVQSLIASAADGRIAELQQQKQELENSLAQAEDGLSQLEESTASARAQIAAGWDEINASRQQLEDAEQQIQDGWQQLESERQNGQAQLDEAAAELKDAKAQIDAMEAGEWTVLDRSQHYATASFDSTIDQMAAIGRIFPLFFLMVAVLVCLTTMARTVDEQRTEIGILRALGYSQLQCAGKYLIYAGIAALIGETVGAVIGMLTFPLIIYNTWKMMYILPEIRLTVDWGLLAVTDAAFLAVMLLTTWLTCKADMREVPAQLLRPKSPKLGRNMLLEKITPVWSRISFTWKVTIRNIVRDKKRFVMTVIGVAGCTALLVTGFGIRDSITGMVDLQYDVITRYDGYVSVDNSLSTSAAEDLVQSIRADGDVEDAEMIEGYTSEAYDSSDRSQSVTVQIFDDGSQVDFAYLLRTRKGHEPLTLSDDGVIISEKLSELLGLKTGDTMRMEDEDGKSMEVTVSGICEMYIDHYCFMTRSCYEKASGSEPLNRMILVRGANDDLSSLQHKLVEDEGITGITFFDATLESFETMVSSLDLVVWTIIISSMALAFVVLGNLINVNISERQREIATLKVLGFHHREVQSYIYKENNILTCCGALAGVPLGIWLHRTIMLTVEMDYVMFGRSISIWSMLISVALTVLFGMMVNFAMRRRLRSIQMVESLKSVE